jgi:hypothetical protein
MGKPWIVRGNAKIAMQISQTLNFELEFLPHDPWLAHGNVYTLR